MNTKNTFCPQLIHPLLIEKIAIDVEEQSSLPIENYEAMNFRNIKYVLEKFITDREHLYFQGYIGHLCLTGNALLYYPTLAKKIQRLNLEDYPFLERTYKVDTRIKGVSAFLEYLAQYTAQCLHQFQVDLAQISHTVNSLIAHHGQERCIPIIDEIVSCDHQQYLVIHGVWWRLAKKYHSQEIDSIHLYDLFQLQDLIGPSYREGCMTLEEATPGTPFIALRIQQTYKHKGRLIWYDLNTKQPISKAARVKWKHSLAEKITQHG